MQVMSDESGKLSMARALLVIQLAIVNVAGVIEAFTFFGFPDVWWALQATIFIGLLAWAAGPRGLQYLGPTVSGTVGTLTEAIRKRVQRTDRSRHDDERDP